MPKQPNVVWVCQWYPHEGDPYAGDFIQRHAKAASLFLPITTFSCFAHTSNKIETQTIGQLTEHIIYFKTVKTGIGLFDKAIKWIKWYRILKKQLQHHFSNNGKPDLLHCHIILNAGWLGLWAKKKIGIPYLVTEHWSGYMPGAINGFAAYNGWSKRMFAKILDNAELVTGVSEALIFSLQQIHPQVKYIRLPNVVDEVIFNLPVQKKASEVFRIIHISTFSAQKNIADIFTAFDFLANENAFVEFHVVGPQEKILKTWPNRKFSSAYVFHNEMPQPNLARLMQGCDVCLLYSHYETFGCVIIEANAAGVPVVVADIPVLREIVHPNENGILVSPSNPQALFQALTMFVNKRHRFQASSISKNTIHQFGFQAIGKQIFELYSSIIAVK